MKGIDTELSKFSIEELRELAGILSEKGLGSIEITDGEYSLKMTAPTFSAVGEIVAAPMASVIAAPSIEQETVPDGSIVASPIVGVFYRAQSPESEPFVKVGSRVSVGDVLCIVEAMKLMNEITAEFDGEVVEVLVENGEVVDCGKPLFRIKELG